MTLEHSGPFGVSENPASQAPGAATSASRAKPIAGATKVAIIGGGCAALSAAFELSRPEHRARYDITIYQMGFRLGGKGASGRGVSGRIEEHGLHLWLGFYENAFRLMRECYAELGRDRFRCPIATWEDAFKPAPCVSVTDRLPNGRWQPWVATFPASPGLPGDPLSEHNPFTLRSYLGKAAALVVELLRTAGADAAHAQPRSTPVTPGSVEALVEGAEWVLRNGRLATAAAAFEATDILRGLLQTWLPDAYRAHDARDATVLRLVDAIADAARRQLQAVLAGDLALQRTWQVIELILAIIRGSISFGLATHPRGFDAIDGYDWREWLALNGASAASLDSGFVRGIYDLVFAYEDGDPQRPQLSAAAALRGAMRMFFTYRGAIFWRMSAGMGDIVFAPLYEVLKKRGVRFEFFHRLRSIEPSLDAEASHVKRLHFDVQAQVKQGEYQPLVSVAGLPCWPARADYTQLVDGARIESEGWELESPWETRSVRQRQLEVGADFDLAVLAVGGGAVRHVSSKLIDVSPRWKRMVDNLHCVATQAFQLWLHEDTRALGWKHGPVNLSGWVEPFDTWADMSHLIPAECFEGRVKSIAYFCSPLKTAAHVARSEAEYVAARATVRDNAVTFLQREISAVWPHAVDPRTGFRWELLVGGEASVSKGSACIDSQFWTANVRPSDRYTLTLPGTSQHRLSPLDMTFDNLTLAGDWTESGLNTGCVESAVMSGLLAAHALSRSPPLEHIIGYDHP